jgi:hypothetical protein
VFLCTLYQCTFQRHTVPCILQVLQHVLYTVQTLTFHWFSLIYKDLCICELPKLFSLKANGKQSSQDSMTKNNGFQRHVHPRGQYKMIHWYIENIFTRFFHLILWRFCNYNQSTYVFVCVFVYLSIFFVVLGFELRALCLLGSSLTTRHTPSPMHVI